MNKQEIKRVIVISGLALLGPLVFAACQPVISTVTLECPPPPTPITVLPPTGTPIPPVTPTPFAGYTCDQLMAPPEPDGTGAGPGFGKFYNDDPSKPIICIINPQTGKASLTHP